MLIAYLKMHTSSYRRLKRISIIQTKGVDTGTIRGPPAGSFVKRENAKKGKKVQNKKNQKKAQVPIDI